MTDKFLFNYCSKDNYYEIIKFVIIYFLLKIF